MLTKRNRDLLPQKTEPTPFAARAKDLGALRDAVVDAASVGAGLWISYLFALFYFAIAAGAVTHRDLLLESPVKLPFLNVELPLEAFFILGPLVFLIVHAYVLLHFVLLAGKISAFHFELQAQISGDDARARLRRQLPSNIFVQSLAGPREVRTGIIGFLLRLIIEISLVAGPIALLILFQLQFLPYHSEWITSWQRIAVVIDLVLLWILWPRIARGENVGLGWSDLKRVKVRAWLLVSILPVILVATIATFPGEWLDNLPPVRLIPTTREAWTLPSVQAIQTAGSGWATLHELLVGGEVNYVTAKPQSLWSNVLVLPNFEVGDRIKFDAEGKIAISSDTLSLRGRSLEGAVLSGAHLRKVDFAGAQLANARFSEADLHKTSFGCDVVGEVRAVRAVACAYLQGANLDGAQLQGAWLNNAELQGANLRGAHLQGATLLAAHLQGADLDDAQLQGADLIDAQLQGADLDYAQLQGAWLNNAELQGASLRGAQLQGATLLAAQLQGAALDSAHLQDALLRKNFLWRTNPPSNTNGAFVDTPVLGPKYTGLDCSFDKQPCKWTDTSYAALKSLIENSVPAGSQRDRALRQIATLEKRPYVVDEASAKAWTDLANESARLPGLNFNTLAKILKEIGCATDGAPYVIGSLTPNLDQRFEGDLSREAEVAATFLDEAKCPGARGLSEENKATLEKIRDRGLPAPPGPGAQRHNHPAE
jgi:uncharacterized protein YjbI with pentapeptide repeats